MEKLKTIVEEIKDNFTNIIEIKYYKNKVLLLSEYNCFILTDDVVLDYANKHPEINVLNFDFTDVVIKILEKEFFIKNNFPFVD